jgi:hypothetical protein
VNVTATDIMSTPESDPPGYRALSEPLARAVSAAEAFSSDSQAPDPAPCYFCDTPAEYVLVPYSYVYGDPAPNGTRLEISRLLPGYHCPACKLDSQDPVLYEAFVKAIVAAIAGGNSRLRKKLLKERQVAA